MEAALRPAREQQPAFLDQKAGIVRCRLFDLYEGWLRAACAGELYMRRKRPVMKAKDAKVRLVMRRGLAFAPDQICIGCVKIYYGT